jgi:hypothetical protein
LQQVSTINRPSELRAEIDAIANVPKANGELAAKTATALVAAYPSQQAQDPMVAKGYMRQLIELLVGQDVDVLAALLSQFARTHKFMPAVAEVADFIESKMEPKRARVGWYLDEIAAIERKHKDEAVTPDERAARADMLRKTAAVIRETVRKKHAFPAWHAPEGADLDNARMEALANLEAGRGPL